MTNVLIVGSGGREHAIGWKLAQSDKVEKIFFAPGNGGTHENVDIKVEDVDKLANFADENHCFTVVGPETPLSLGIVDTFNEKSLDIFGPTRSAARLESSKIWAKNFMKRNGISTATFESFDDSKDAIEYAKCVNRPLVVKADGLASGKGVIVCNDTNDAISAINRIQINQEFGSAGSKIILEEYIDGKEISFIALSDGDSTIPMVTARDHKRVGNGNVGPNTGGMGAYSPVPMSNDSLSDTIHNDIILKTIYSMKQEGDKFTGFLYAGVMIKDDIPYVLEYNVRMGDPECQPILMRMKSDLFPYLYASSKGALGNNPEISWTPQSAVCIVLASQGYPESYSTGEKITGLSTKHDSMIFHAGTRRDGDDIFSNGGRVLGVTTLGDTLETAAQKAYHISDNISWNSKYYRRDIGVTL